MTANTSKILIGFYALVMLGCGRFQESPSEPPPVQVTVSNPVVMTIVEWDEYTGRLEATDSIEVRSRVSGYLSSIHFDEGQEIKKGDLLAIVDPRPFEAELNSATALLKEAEATVEKAKAVKNQAIAQQAVAEAQLSLADQNLNRARALANQISEEELDIRKSEKLQAEAAKEASNSAVASAEADIATSKAGIETAKANVMKAQLDLYYTRVYSPIDGRISRRYVSEGNLISGGSNQSTLITNIVSLNPMHCYFDANEQAFLKYVRLSQDGKRESSREVKNPVFGALIDEQGFPHKGHMDFVDNQIDPNTGTMRGRAIFPNDDGLLTPGLFLRVRLPGSGRYQAVLIPDRAVGVDQTDQFVYVVDSDGLISRRTITLGEMSHGLRIVTSGLDGTEKIVTRGLQRIYPDVKVEFEQETIEASDDNSLPDDYQPIPKEKWLSRPTSTTSETDVENEGGQ